MNVNDYNDINIYYNYINMDLFLLNCYFSILQMYFNLSYDLDDKCLVFFIQEFNKMKVLKIIFLYFFSLRIFEIMLYLCF